MCIYERVWNTDELKLYRFLSVCVYCPQSACLSICYGCRDIWGHSVYTYMQKSHDALPVEQVEGYTNQRLAECFCKLVWKRFEYLKLYKIYIYVIWTPSHVGLCLLNKLQKALQKLQTKLICLCIYFSLCVLFICCVSQNKREDQPWFVLVFISPLHVAVFIPEKIPFWNRGVASTRSLAKSLKDKLLLERNNRIFSFLHNPPHPSSHPEIFPIRAQTL